VACAVAARRVTAAYRRALNILARFILAIPSPANIALPRISYFARPLIFAVLVLLNIGLVSLLSGGSTGSDIHVGTVGIS